MASECMCCVKNEADVNEHSWLMMNSSESIVSKILCSCHCFTCQRCAALDGSRSHGSII